MGFRLNEDGSYKAWVQKQGKAAISDFLTKSDIDELRYGARISIMPVYYFGKNVNDIENAIRLSPLDLTPT